MHTSGCTRPIGEPWASRICERCRGTGWTRWLASVEPASSASQTQPVVILLPPLDGSCARLFHPFSVPPTSRASRDDAPSSTTLPFCPTSPARALVVPEVPSSARTTVQRASPLLGSTRASTLRSPAPAFTSDGPVCVVRRDCTSGYTSHASPVFFSRPGPSRAAGWRAPRQRRYRKGSALA